MVFHVSNLHRPSREPTHREFLPVFPSLLVGPPGHCFFDLFVSSHVKLHREVIHFGDPHHHVPGEAVKARWDTVQRSFWIKERSGSGNMSNKRSVQQNVVLSLELTWKWKTTGL